MERSDLISIFSSCLADPSLSLCSGDHPGAAHDTHSATQAASSSDFANSYKGDDARRFHHEWNATINHYSEATRHNGQLKFALNASQAALSAAEGEANMVRVQLAESDARVASKTFKASAFFVASTLPIF
jgi:hypothetical protein